MKQRNLFVPAVLFLCLVSSQSLGAQRADSCDPAQKRALVLSGGGLKGAFQAGAVYHLVVHRHCDFHDFAGVSVGSLNSVILAQARRDADSSEASWENLAQRVEVLVDIWQGIRSPKQILKPRWPGWKWALFLRFGFFGMENLNSFDPLMKLIQANVDVDALAEQGRPVRVGSVSFSDGVYREVGPTARFPNNDRRYFLQYLYGSALIPVVGRMPRIQQADGDTDPRGWTQFGDGGVLHNTPIFNYFRKCPPETSPAESQGQATTADSCHDWLRLGTPPPQQVQQLFVVVTGPFTRRVDTYPIQPELLARGRRQVTDGRKILLRTLDLVLQSAYRGDLNLMLAANDLLAWRKRYYQSVTASLTPEQREEFDRSFAEINRDFPLDSYNPAPDGGWSLPYEVGLVAPEKAYAGTFEVDSENIALQFHHGCLAADAMMQKDFGMTAMTEKCLARFPLPASKSKKSNGRREEPAAATSDPADDRIPANPGLR